MDGALCLSITGFSCYFSFSRISSALMPSASSFFRTDSASAFFASSAALASALAFFASSVTTSFSAFFRAIFFSFRSAFKVSMLEVMDAISAAKGIHLNLVLVKLLELHHLGYNLRHYHAQHHAFIKQFNLPAHFQFDVAAG